MSMSNRVLAIRAKRSLNALRNDDVCRFVVKYLGRSLTKDEIYLIYIREIYYLRNWSDFFFVRTTYGQERSMRLVNWQTTSFDQFLNLLTPF